MDSKVYEILHNDGPLPEKYLTSHISCGSSDTDSVKDDVDMKASLSSGDNTDGSAGELETIAGRCRVPRSGGWGSAESGLNYIGRSRMFGGCQDHGSYVRRSEERERAVPISPSMPSRRTKGFGSFSEQKTHRQTLPVWLPVNTENILAKVRDLLGTQATRNKMTDSVDGQKTRKRLTLDGKRTEPLKARHATPPTDMGLDAQVLFNLEMKNRENAVQPEDRGPDDETRFGQNKKDLNIDESVRKHTEMGESHWSKGLSGLAFSASRNADTVPTAHVSPNLLNHHSTSSLHRFPSDESLHGRHVTSSEHRNLVFVSGDDGPKLSGVPTRWNSQQNMTSNHDPEEFQSLPSASDNSILHNSSYCMNNDENIYRHRGVAVGVPMGQTQYDRPGVQTARLPSNAAIPGQPLLVGSQQAREYPYSYPHDGQKMLDRSYPYSHSTSTSGYNTQNYSTVGYGSQFVSSIPSSGSGHFTNDFASWEQKHQESLRKQQMEISEQPYHIHTTPSVSSLLIGDPHKLDSIKHAADNIIKEKDMIIERQKLKIMELERGYKESDALALKLQENEYENMSLKRQLAEEGFSSNRSSKSHLEDKLGEAEYEIQHLKMLMKSEADKRKNESTKLLEKLKDKDNLILEWKDKHLSLKTSHEALQKKLSDMERYLADLPSMDETSKKDKLVRSLQEDNVKYKQQVSELEKKLSDARKGLSSRDALIKSLEENVTDMEKRVEKLEARNKKLKEQLNKDGAGFNDIEEIQYENKKLKSDLDKAKKLLETAQKRTQQLEAHYKAEITELKERLSQEESAVVALREEMLCKEQHLKKLRQSVKEISSQNQDLIDANMMLKDRVKMADSQTAGDIRKLERRLMKEVSACFAELSNLVHICVQQAEGQDPNVSLLLGIRDAGDPEVEQDSADTLESLKSKVTKMRELRDEVDRLRELLSNKCAEDMCQNMNRCSTQ